jgi:hypothetical protein
MLPGIDQDARSSLDLISRTVTGSGRSSIETSSCTDIDGVAMDVVIVRLLSGFYWFSRKRIDAAGAELYRVLRRMRSIGKRVVACRRKRDVFEAGRLDQGAKLS